MKANKWTILSVAFAALLAISLYGCSFFIRMPPTRSKNIVDLQYTQSASYSYTAFVKPSFIYDNRTEISTGEPLYINLVERLNITLQYNFTQTPSLVEMIDTKLRYEASADLSGGDWTKNLLRKPRSSKPTSFTDTYTIDIEEVEGIVETIGEETGTSVYAYTYEIKPSISLKASAGVETIEQEFNPTLTVKFEGGKIEFDGLTSTQPESITHQETEAATWSLLRWTAAVEDMRKASIITSISLAALLAASIHLTIKERAARPLQERLSGDIKDKIIEASEPPERIEKATIKVGSLEDLAKVSEETFKPIIHHGDVFYVLDGDMRYEYTLKEAVEAQEKERERPEGSREKPELKRVECPYSDTEGKRCGVVAFGPTEAAAYKKLESHIEKEHPDKLKEFKDAHDERV